MKHFRRYSFFILLSLLLISVHCYAIRVTEIRCENQICPLGVDTEKPVFSWKLTSDQRGITQKAYRILVSESEKDLKNDQGTCWDTGMQLSGQSLNITYDGKKLQSGRTYYWKVNIWNQTDHSSWSATATFQMGLLSEEDWQPAQWIAMEEIHPDQRSLPGYEIQPVEKEPAMPQFRRSFLLDKPVAGAIMFITGLGHFELSINGEKTGDHFLDPGWSNYEKTSYYVTFDVTGQLNKGENVIGVRLGNGFLHIPRDENRYKKLVTSYSFPKMICKLQITYTDGTTEQIVSNEEWKVTASPVTFSSIYGGEDFDATLDEKGWNDIRFDDRHWKKPILVSSPGTLVSQTAPPLKVKQKFSKISIEETQPGIYIYDFGQNASAIISLKIKGAKGSKVIMRPAEYLTDEGLANQRSSGENYYFSYTTGSDETESWHPSFSYYGFRYVQIEGAVPKGMPNPSSLPVVEDLEMWHVRNDSETVGTFTCSNELFNQIYSLIDWSVKSNMASVLTDCPHREKLGWMEVAHLMSKSIGYAYDIQRMYGKMMRDMKNTQQVNGLITSTAPEFSVFPDDFRDSPEWGSAGVIIPWFLYTWYGDRSILSDSYDLMKKYTDYLTSRSTSHIISHGLGDWYDLGPEHPGYSQLTTRGLTSTAIYYYDLCIMAQVARLIDKQEDADLYRLLAEQVKRTFNQTFFNHQKGYYDQGSQTANSMPLYLGLVEEPYVENVFNQLINDIRSRDNSITAGDIGYGYLLRVLEKGEASEVIFDMNSQTDKPGYGYQLKQGATSLTESWNALKTASHNHCMLGHLMEWFYSGLGGIKPDEGSIAFKRFIIHPHMVGDITDCQVSFNSPYGMISNEWEKTENGYRFFLEIPANTSAYVYFPINKKVDIQENGINIDKIESVRFVKKEKEALIYEVLSGTYEFIGKAQ